MGLMVGGKHVCYLIIIVTSMGFGGAERRVSFN